MVSFFCYQSTKNVYSRSCLVMAPMSGNSHFPDQLPRDFLQNLAKLSKTNQPTKNLPIHGCDMGLMDGPLGG